MVPHEEYETPLSPFDDDITRSHSYLHFQQQPLLFLVFGVAGSVKSMQCGYSLDAESNSASNELSQSKFE